MPDRILFICGSLAPGEDGVGDYTRRLASELKTRGVTLQLVAAFDKAVDTLTEEVQPEGDHFLPCIRIPYATPAAQRMEYLQEIIDAFNPGVVSLQYVPYSFSPYGIPLRFIGALGALPYRGRWHVMFHELWIVHRGLRTPKGFIVSTLQRLSVAVTGYSLRPEVVHTHIPSYRKKLRGVAIQALPLPLFANIGPRQNGAVPARDITTFRAGFFSQLIVERTLDSLHELRDWVAGQGHQLEILLLGGGKSKISEARKVLQRELPAARIVTPGFLAAEDLSDRLRSLDLGITPVDHHLVGKSGTVSAFLVHGVPVLAPYLTESGPGFFDAGLGAAVFQRFTPANLAAARAAVGRIDTTSLSSAGAATRFMADLDLRVRAGSRN